MSHYRKLSRVNAQTIMSKLACAALLSVITVLSVGALGQSTSNFRSPLVYGYQADPMMVTYGGMYYLFVDDQLGYDRFRTSASIAGLGSAESQIVWTPPQGSGVDSTASCAFIFQWSGKWYQYCGDSKGNFVIESSGASPLGPYSFMARITPPPSFTGYAAWPIQVGSQIYMLITTNGMGTSYNSIYAAKFSDPGTQSGPWSPIAVPTGGSGSWECADGRCIDEGGSAVVHGNKVFLLFSAGGPHWLNPGAPGWQTHLTDQVRSTILDYGIDGAFFDTQPGFENDRRFSPVEGLRKIVSNLRDEFPNLMIATESWSDLTYGFLHAGQTPAGYKNWSKRYGRRFATQKNADHCSQGYVPGLPPNKFSLYLLGEEVSCLIAPRSRPAHIEIDIILR